MSLLVTITVACWALPAHADLASYEREQKAKHARLVQLNEMLKDAMDATPSTYDDAVGVQKAADKMAKLADTVKAELATDKLRTPGTAFGTVQDNLRRLDERVTSVKLAARAAKALAKLEPIAAAHGEAAAADLAEAAKLVDAMGTRRGELPDGEEALAKRHRKILAMLAETPWPTSLRPIEISRTDLDAHILPINATVEGKREQSIAILQITTRMREVYRWGGEHRGVRYALWGPVVEKNGIVTGAIQPREWKDLEAGTYLIRATGSGATTNVRIVLSTKDTPTEPFMQVGEIAADAPLAQRRLDAIYPFLGDMTAEHVRQKAFLLAPREAFVYARETFRREDVGVGMGDIYPQTDEPLLVVGRGDNGAGVRVINAEGFSWSLYDTKLLATKPAGAPVLPATIHPLDSSYEVDELKDANTFETGAQAPIAKKYLASIETWNTCVDKVLDKYGGAAANDYDVITYRAGKVVKVEGLSEKAWKEADRTCRTKKVKAQWEAWDKLLSDAQNADRARYLDAIKKAWAS
jgi:hypothetical protein